MTNLTKEFVGKFVGLNKIRVVTEVEEKTYLSNPKVRVEYKGDAKPEVYPLAVLRTIATKDKTDLTKLRDLRVFPVIKGMLILLTEAELSKADVIYATGARLIESINESMRVANDILWGKEDMDITLKDVDDVIKNRKTFDKK